MWVCVTRGERPWLHCCAWIIKKRTSRVITSDHIPVCQRSTDISVCIMTMKLSLFLPRLLLCLPAQLAATLFILSSSSISPTFPIYLLFSQCPCLSQWVISFSQSFIPRLNSSHVPEGRAGVHGSADGEDRGGKEESKIKRHPIKMGNGGIITNVWKHCVR